MLAEKPKGELHPLLVGKECSLYRVQDASGATLRRLVGTTPETRRICNDPFCAGVEYTQALGLACSKVLLAMRQSGLLDLREESTVVLHILRGGLNFGLREALFQAFHFIHHSSAFISAQRARKKDNPQDWFITESDYQKVTLHGASHIIFGDVVATGTSLEHALQRLLMAAKQEGSTISGITFFTIGSARSEEILSKIDAQCRSQFPQYQNSQVVYIEGVFETASQQTPMHIKIDGTDLLRANALLAPEFIDSQYECAAYPIERCTIYDAGSRAFDLAEYYADVKEYWSKNLALAQGGITFDELVAERFPELDQKRFGQVSLSELCRQQLSKLPQNLNLARHSSGE